MYTAQVNREACEALHKSISNRIVAPNAQTCASNGEVALAGTQWTAELLRRAAELTIPSEMFQVAIMDLVVRNTPAIPEGSNDVEATRNVGRTLLAVAENTPRLAGETIYRHAGNCKPEGGTERVNAHVQICAGDPGTPGFLGR